MIRVGQKFQEERLRKNLTIEEVSSSTKIREDFLEAIEKGEYDKLPSPAYATGFVRNYARFLDLPEDETLAIFRREFDEEKAYQILPRGLSENSEFAIRKIKIGRPLILTFIIFFALLGYILFQYRSAILNPPLTLSTPKNNQIFNSVNVPVSGKTDPNASVFIEDQQVPVGEDGTFQKNMTFFPGNINILVTSVNKFGRKSKISTSIVVRP